MNTGKNKWKVSAVIVLALLVMGIFCMRNSFIFHEEKEKIPEIKIYTFASYDMTDEPLVEHEVNKIAEEKYHVRFDLSFLPASDWIQQLEILLTGQEADIIAVYGKPLMSFVEDNQLADLTEYYENSSDKMKAIWSEQELKGTSVKGKIYGIPTFRNYGNYFGLNIDEKIAAEYGIEDGQRMTMEDVDVFLHDVHEEYPERYALVPQGRDVIINEWTWDGLGDTSYIGVLPMCGQTTTVQNLYETEDFRQFCSWIRYWNQDGLIMEDVLSNMEQWQTLIREERGISCLDNYGVNRVEGMIRTVIIDKWCVSNSYSACAYGINNNSVQKEAAWKAMEILYTDKEISILLNNGIENLHYVKNQDGTISFPEGKSVENCGYGMSESYWIMPYSANSLPLDVNGPFFFESMKQFNQSATKSKAFGFTYELNEAADAYAACVRIHKKYYKALMSGVLDVNAALKQVNKELKEAGIEEVIAEKQRQLDAFLAANS